MQSSLKKKKKRRMKDNMIHSVSVDYLRSLVTENPDQREGRIKAKTVG